MKPPSVTLAFTTERVPKKAAWLITLTTTVFRHPLDGDCNPAVVQYDVVVCIVHPGSPPAFTIEHVSGNRTAVNNVVAPPAAAAGGDIGATEDVTVGEDTAAGGNAAEGKTARVGVVRLVPD